MDILTKQSQNLTYTDWSVSELAFDPSQLQARETLFAIGNGYLGTRGSFEEGFPGASPATFVHGIYDYVPIVYSELVNCPDWLPLMVVVDGDRFRLDQGEILHYRRELDLRQGLLTRLVRWRSPSGKTVELRFERFTSLADQHVVALRCHITPIGEDSRLEVQASINGYPENQGFNHWEHLGQGKTAHGAWLQVRTRTSRQELAIASGMAILGIEATSQVTNVPGYPTLLTSFTATAGQTITVENLVIVYTSREVENPVESAQAKLAELPSYPELLKANEAAWAKIWQDSDIVIEGDVKAQLAVRYSLFQLLIAAPPTDDRVSIPAKTLTGFGYRGHVFWDTEIFILPFFTFTQPTLARNLLTYRYRTLAGARRKAKDAGYKGAMYAWESADTGDEVTPRWSILKDFYDKDERVWCRDQEVHISADVAYAAWYYWQGSGDDAWMCDYGAEIIFDTAVFWMSRVEWDTRYERYEIKQVIGADEYHEHVDNNAFTNRMVQWHLEKAIVLYDWLKQQHPDRLEQLNRELQITSGRRLRWQDIVANLWIPYSDSGLIEQSDGFFQLKDLDLQTYEPRTDSMHKLLQKAGDDCNKRQVLKQPDVLMLLYLMRQSQEFPYSQKALEANWQYYAPRTDISYGSSLGPAIHAILASDLGQPAAAYELFMQAALVDLEDTRGNAAEGIHAASAGGIWQTVILGFGGIQFAEDAPFSHPHLPPGWTRLKFKLHWRGKWHEFDLKPNDPASQPLLSPDSIEQLAAPIEPDPIEHNPKVKPPNIETIVMTKSAPTQPLPDIQGVIFDLDGVLTDTAEYHYRAWQRLADEAGIPFDREANEDLRGISRRESLLKIIGDRSYSEAEIEEMMERKNRYYVESIDEISPQDLLPGALPLLDELRKAGIKTAIGSASKNAHAVVEKLGIADRVDEIADGYSVERPKPAPDLFLHAADLIQVAPDRCVVVEDAEAGVEAALAAGMWGVGLGPRERVGSAHVVLPDLADTGWASLQAKLQQAATRQPAQLGQR